jgi:hypothetical protein
MQPKRLIGPETFHLELSEGMDYTFKFVYTDDSTLLPVDLTGYRGDLYIRPVLGTPVILKGISTQFSYPEGSITMGSDGLVTLQLNGEFTTDLQWTDAFYDMVLTDPNQKRSKILRGRVNIYNTNTFPLNYSPVPPEDYLGLTSGKTILPNGLELYGYMNPIKLGIGGGLLLTGAIRPSVYQGFEVVELSYSGGNLRVTFAGNVPSGMVYSMKLGTQLFLTSASEGRVFNQVAATIGLTFWEWRNVLNPFGENEGWATTVVFAPDPDLNVAVDAGSF